MARITQESLTQLHEAVDIVALISHYIDVRKVGANFMSACPFHDDKTPSMSISPAKGLYHCHACGASGNAIRFVMEYERLPFFEAAQKIANMFHITLTYEKGAIAQKKSDLLQTLALFYHNKLFQHKDIMDYLTSRGITMESIRNFEIGYSGTNLDTLRFLDMQKFSRKEAIEYGVISDSNDRAYARFANRIIFPIYSGMGSVVGFGGRTLSPDKNIAKYLNSPQSKIFNKSKILYGYHLAKQAVYKTKEIIVCEGYLDVILLHQAGFKNAVATLGTALNEGHLYLLGKNDPSIYVCYDGDTAGINAAFKAAKFLSQNNKDGGVILLSNGLDPADMVAQGKTALFQESLQNAKPFIEFVLEHIAKGFDLANPMQKQDALQAVEAYLHTLTIALQDAYKQKCAFLLQIHPDRIKTEEKTSKDEENVPNNTSKDLIEESILYNMLASSEHFYFAINYVDTNYFRFYKEEFELICRGDCEHEKIYALRFLTENKILSHELFKEQLRLLILRYAKELLPQLGLSTSKDRFRQIQNLKQQIIKLDRQKELVSISLNALSQQI